MSNPPYKYDFSQSVAEYLKISDKFKFIKCTPIIYRY